MTGITTGIVQGIESPAVVTGVAGGVVVACAGGGGTWAGVDAGGGVPWAGVLGVEVICPPCWVREAKMAGLWAAS